MGLAKYCWQCPGAWHLPLAVAHSQDSMRPCKPCLLLQVGTHPEVWPLQRRSRLNTSKYLLREANSIAAKSLTTFSSRNRFGKESWGSGTPGQQPRLLPPPTWGGDGSYTLGIFSSLLVTLTGCGDMVVQLKCSAVLHAIRHTCNTCSPPCIQTSPWSGATGLHWGGPHCHRLSSISAELPWRPLINHHPLPDGIEPKNK